MRRFISQNLRRGKIYIFVECPNPAVFSSRLILNEAMAKEIFHKIKQLKHILKLEHSIPDEAVLREVLRSPDLLRTVSPRRLPTSCSARWPPPMGRTPRTHEP